MTEPNDTPERLGDMEATLHAPPAAGQPRFSNRTGTEAVAGSARTRSATSLPSFDGFYESTYDDLARALSITLGDAGWGREAADEAMTRAYDRWADVVTYANPAGWVYRVGLNWARSWHRKLNRKLPWSSPEVSLPKSADTELEAALAQLDVKYRSVVVCRYLLDWTTEQTAAALDLPAGTVKSRLSTGLTHLRTILGEPDAPTDASARTQDDTKA